jgi:hypothetical protein
MGTAGASAAFASVTGSRITWPLVGSANLNLVATIIALR